MKYCQHCGNEMEDYAIACTKCGAGTNIVEDKESVGLNILSFFFPLIGLVLYLVFKDQQPIKAKACGKWAAIAVGVVVGFYALMVVIAIMGAMAFSSY